MYDLSVDTRRFKGLKNKYSAENFDSTLKFDRYLKIYQSKSRLLVKLWICNFSKMEVDVVMEAFGELLAQLFVKRIVTVALNSCENLY